MFSAEKRLEKHNQVVQYDNTVAYCPKIMGIPECVDMATVAMATELGHMSVQMLFIH